MGSQDTVVDEAIHHISRDAETIAMEAVVDEATKRLNYKLLKESFVSNLTGSSIGDINMVTMASPLSGALWAVLQSRQEFFKPYGVIPALADYAINVGTLLLSVTLYAGQSLLLQLAILIPIFILLLLPRSNENSRKSRKPSTAALSKKANNKDEIPRKRVLHTLGLKPFLTMYRGSMMMMTVIAILAVDFHVFPRRFAKVETWGTSLMDLGVGSFVFSAGVVGARPILKDHATGKKTSVVVRVLSSLRHSLPLLVLGFIRMLSVKGLEYAEHTTEYGVHWNFFFTLGFLPPFVAASTSLYNLIPSFAGQALVISGLYQLALSFTPLQNYIIIAERVDLVSKNREGLFSFFGYLAIFLAGQDMGMWVLPRQLNIRPPSTPATQRNSLLKLMFAWSAIWSVLYTLSTNYYIFGLTVSRRMANFPYVLWTAAFNATQIMLCCIIETFFFPKAHNLTGDAKAEKEIHDASTSRLYRAVNRNGLVIFLVANLLTGLVNMTVPTLDVSRNEAMVILVVYTGAVSVLALILDHYDITIKL